MGITLYSLGAAEEVTGSKHILEIDGRQVMIDCGAFQGKRCRVRRNIGAAFVNNGNHSEGDGDFFNDKTVFALCPV